VNHLNNSLIHTGQCDSPTWQESPINFLTQSYYPQYQLVLIPASSTAHFRVSNFNPSTFHHFTAFSQPYHLSDLTMSAQRSDGSPRSGRTGGPGLGSLSPSEGEHDVAAGPYGMHRKLNEDQSLQAIKTMAHGYLNSFPGANNMANNTMLHGDARNILEGTKLNAWRLGRLQAGLRYRLESMDLASEYKDIAGLDFLDCEAFDLQSWQETADSESEDRRAPNHKHDLASKFTNVFDDADLFDPPVGEEGYAYSKPWDYLGVACLESGLDLDGVRKALSKMQEGRGSSSPVIEGTTQILTPVLVKAARVEALDAENPQG